MKFFLWLVFCMATCVLLVGCHANYSVSRVPQSNLQTEGTVVFDRASRNNLFFGNRSLVEYVEVVYDRFSVNEAGQPVVEVGIRYKGPDSWTNWVRVSATVRCGRAKRCGRDR